jgi:hypothetical protein
MRRISRDLRFEAWFLWMMPLAAALSSRLTALRSASTLLASSTPAVSASRTDVLMRVLISERAALLRRRRRSFCRFRFIWLLMFATRGRR